MDWPVDEVNCSAPPASDMEMKKMVLRAEIPASRLLDPAAYSS